MLTIILGLLVAAQQYLIPWIIPAFGRERTGAPSPDRAPRPPYSTGQTGASPCPQIAFPVPDATILARRDAIVAGLAAILPPEA